VAQNLIHGDESLVAMINLLYVKFVQTILVFFASTYLSMKIYHIHNFVNINLQTSSKYVGVEIF
jgi:hypothetical protein